MYPANTLEEWYDKNYDYKPIISFSALGITRQVENVSVKEVEIFLDEFIQAGKVKLNDGRYSFVRY